MISMVFFRYDKKLQPGKAGYRRYRDGKLRILPQTVFKKSCWIIFPHQIGKREITSLTQEKESSTRLSYQHNQGALC